MYLFERIFALRALIAAAMFATSLCSLLLAVKRLCAAGGKACGGKLVVVGRAQFARCGTGSSAKPQLGPSELPSGNP